MTDYQNIEIIIDTREQQPWHFPKHNTVTAKLDTGDYSIKGYENIFCIERKKSVSEIANNITEKRFLDVIDRLKKIKYSYFLFEFNLEDIMIYPEGSNIPKKLRSKIRISPGYIIKLLTEIQVMHSIPIIFCGSAKNAETVAMALMRRVYENEQ